MWQQVIVEVPVDRIKPFVLTVWKHSVSNQNASSLQIGVVGEARRGKDGTGTVAELRADQPCWPLPARALFTGRYSLGKKCLVCRWASFYCKLNSVVQFESSQDLKSLQDQWYWAVGTATSIDRNTDLNWQKHKTVLQKMFDIGKNEEFATIVLLDQVRNHQETLDTGDCYCLVPGHQPCL